MRIKIITDLSQAVIFIEELQKENDELQKVILKTWDEIVKDPQFRIRGKSLIEINRIVSLYETQRAKEVRS